jgi:hypothetical protein
VGLGRSIRQVVLSQRSLLTCYLTSIPSKKAVTSDRPLKKRMRSPTHHGGSSSPPRASTRLKGESSQHGQCFTPPWASSSSSAPRPVYDDNGVMWVPYQQAFHPGWSGQKSTFDRISRPIQDRLAPRRSGQGHQTRPVRPVRPEKSCHLL